MFVAGEINAEDERLLRKASFAMHEPSLCIEKHKCKPCKAGVGRRWWSVKAESASRLRNFCNEKAQSVLKEHLSRIDKSKAVDSEIIIPKPQGRDYLGYQKAGIAYAVQRTDTLFGDEPGLGKTIQAIGFVNYLNPKNVLVVCPSTLKTNWKIEAERWLVDRKWKIYITESSAAVPTDYNFVITNYEKLIKDSPLSQSLKQLWEVLVLDEAHALKNPDSKRTAAVLSPDSDLCLMRRARRTLFLTGTPLLNRPREIFPIAAAICPAKFGNWTEFSERYCNPHIRNGYWNYDGHSNLEELQQRLRSSFMVRRLKKQVLKELPPKRRQLVVLDDSKLERDPALEKWMQRYEEEWKRKNLQLDEAKTEAEYKSAVRQLDAFTGIAFTEISEFRHKTALRKLPLCIDYIDDFLAQTREKVILFAHHQDVLETLVEHYGTEKAVSLWGDTKTNSRTAAVEKFQTDPKCRVFIGGLSAAGVGITLTAASTVIFIESSWVPAVVTQAEDRAHRIGQTENVHIIQLVLNNTLDANMIQRIIEKQNIIDRALDKNYELKSKAAS